MTNISLLDVLIVFIKAGVAMGMLLHMAAMITWVERKGAALIQNRVGANRAGILGWDLAGIINTLLCDPVKAITKEDFIPRGTSAFMHALAPFLAVFPIVLSFAVIPFGPPLIIGDRTIELQVANLNVGILYLFAMGSLAVYGVVLAGWVSDNKFALFGSLRASAQMISYEVTMGLSIVGLLATYGTLDLSEITVKQTGTLWPFLPKWGIFLYFPLNIVSFLLFFTSMIAETKRAPFDLPESESELVAGYFTEYSGMKFLLFWLGEFAEIVVASSVVTVLFFGGWQLPYYDIRNIHSIFGYLECGAWPAIIGAAIFGAKVSILSVLQVVIRWTLPRFRYDQVMNLCWLLMLPLSLGVLFISGFCLVWFGPQ